MSSRWKILTGLVVVIAAGAAYVLWPEKDEFAETLAGYQFVVLRPPTTLYPPGTVVAIRQKKPLVFDQVCSQRSSLGDSIQVASSPTANSALARKVSRSFNLDAAYPELIAAKPEFKAIGDAHFTLSNATVSELSADRLIANIANRRPECATAIQRYLEQGREVSMISATLRADVTFAVDFDRDIGLTAEQKQKLVADLATTLGLTYDATRSQVISGTGLDWGFRDNGWWATLKKDTTLTSVPTVDPALAMIRKHVTDSIVRTGGSVVGRSNVIEALAVIRDTAQATRPIAEQTTVAIPARFLDRVRMR